MSGYGTPYVETEAILFAAADADVDSGNIDLTVEYVAANCTDGELARLERAADTLSEACHRARVRAALAAASPSPETDER